MFNEKKELLMRKEKYKNFEISQDTFLNSLKGPYKEEYKKKFQEMFKKLDNLTIYTINNNRVKFRELIDTHGEVYPIVDKKLNNIFVFGGKKHIDLTGLLYAYYHEEDSSSLEDILTAVVYADSFIDDCQGYYLSSVPFLSGGGWMMSKKYIIDNFDNNFLLNEKEEIKRLGEYSSLMSIRY